MPRACEDEDIALASGRIEDVLSLDKPMTSGVSSSSRVLISDSRLAAPCMRHILQLTDFHATLRTPTFVLSRRSISCFCSFRLITNANLARMTTYLNMLKQNN
jgi:hypothetical protein